MRTIFLLLCLSLSGSAMDAVVIRWHDGKIIRIEGGAKSLVTVKLSSGTITVDNRKVSTMRTIFEWLTMKTLTDTSGSVTRGR